MYRISQIDYSSSRLFFTHFPQYGKIVPYPGKSEILKKPKGLNYKHVGFIIGDSGSPGDNTFIGVPYGKKEVIIGGWDDFNGGLKKYTLPKAINVDVNIDYSSPTDFVANNLQKNGIDISNDKIINIMTDNPTDNIKNQIEMTFSDRGLNTGAGDRSKDVIDRLKLRQKVMMVYQTSEDMLERRRSGNLLKRLQRKLLIDFKRGIEVFTKTHRPGTLGKIEIYNAAMDLIREIDNAQNTNDIDDQVVAYEKVLNAIHNNGPIMQYVLMPSGAENLSSWLVDNKKTQKYLDYLSDMPEEDVPLNEEDNDYILQKAMLSHRQADYEDFLKEQDALPLHITALLDYHEANSTWEIRVLLYPHERIKRLTAEEYQILQDIFEIDYHFTLKKENERFRVWESNTMSNYEGVARDRFRDITNGLFTVLNNKFSKYDKAFRMDTVEDNQDEKKWRFTRMTNGN